MTVIVDDAQLQDAMKRLGQALGNTAPVMQEVGLGLRGYVRQTITMGGRPSWPPLARLTMAVKGRTKPLAGMERHIGFSSTDSIAVVFWANPAAIGWDANLHHSGYRFGPAIGRPVMRINTRGRPIYFTKRKGGTVPARPIWPDVTEATAVAENIVFAYGRRVIGPSWR